MITEGSFLRIMRIALTGGDRRILNATQDNRQKSSSDLTIVSYTAPGIARRVNSVCAEFAQSKGPRTKIARFQRQLNTPRACNLRYLRAIFEGELIDH